MGSSSKLGLGSLARARGPRPNGPRAQWALGPWALGQMGPYFWEPVQKPNRDGKPIFRNWSISYESTIEPQRNYESFPGGLASRSLICVRKRRKPVITKHPLSEGDDDGGGAGGRISQPHPAPFPIAPRDPISRSGIPLTSIIYHRPAQRAIEVRGINIKISGVTGLFII